MSRYSEERTSQRSFVYQDVPLHSEEEFMSLAPEELRKTEVVSDDHQLMLNRLRFELAERERSVPHSSSSIIALGL